MSFKTIDDLLRMTGARLSGKSDVPLAQSRINHSKFLANNYLHWDLIRPHLLHPEIHRTYKNDENSEFVIQYLASEGLIKNAKSGVLQFSSDTAKAYLSGQWLEELVYFAYLEAGVEEAYFSQVIDWTLNGINGRNEIDVIARRGDTLSFTSCKAMNSGKNKGSMDKLRNYITETDYWNNHFANNKGKALLVASTDMVDEYNSKHRYEQLTARAQVLDVHIIGLEDISWPNIVDRIDGHWD